MITVLQLKGKKCKFALELEGACFVMSAFGYFSPLILFLHAL